MLCLLWIFWFLLLDLHSGNSGIGICINNLLPLVILLVKFKLVIISATSNCLARHSLVLWVELLCNSHHFPVSFFDFVVFFFSCIFGRLSWAAMPWLFPLFYGLGAPLPCFWFEDPKSHFFCLNFYLILSAYQYVASSEEMSRNSISSWIYMWKQLRYLSTKCFSEYLIPNFMRRVWNRFVSSCTSWSLCCRSMVHWDRKSVV